MSCFARLFPYCCHIFILMCRVASNNCTHCIYVYASVLIDTDCIICGAGSIKWSSVCLSVPSIDSSSGGRWVCCWVPCGQEILIDSCQHWRRIRAAGMLSSKCGQCYVDHRGTMLNTDLFYSIVKAVFMSFEFLNNWLLFIRVVICTVHIKTKRFVDGTIVIVQRCMLHSTLPCCAVYFAFVLPGSTNGNQSSHLNSCSKRSRRWYFGRYTDPQNCYRGSDWMSYKTF